MPSTYSPNLRIELIANGEQSGTWGTTTNTNLGTLVEDAISGYVSVSITSANQALVAANGSADQARNMVVNLTTTTLADFNVYAPPAEKVYVIRNSSAYNATIYCGTSLTAPGNVTAAGSGVVIPAGRETLVFSDATNVVAAVDYAPSLVLGSALSVTSGGTGSTTASGARANLGAAASGANSDITSLSGLTTALSVSQGGTGSTTASGARTNLGLGTIATQDASSVTITGGSITGITDLAVADGGTGASDASTARTNLGLGTISTQASSNVSITGGSITGITDLAVADGGTGASSFTANNVLLGNGSSSFQTVAPGTSGNILTSNGTTWVSGTAFVTGMIMMWSGTIATIPSGWALCNGSGGTPDLRDRFIVGASVDSGGQSVTTITGANTKTGGTKDAIVVSHSHTATTSITDPGHSHNYTGTNVPGGSGAGDRQGVLITRTTVAATTGITASTSISTEGSSGTNQNLPPYFALAYIMKT